MDERDERSDPDSRRADSRLDSYHAQYDWSTPEPVSVAVIRAVAAVTGRKLSEVSALYTRLDPEALNELFRPTQDLSRRDGHVSFTLDGQAVTVHGDGEIVIVPSDG